MQIHLIFLSLSKAILNQHILPYAFTYTQAHAHAHSHSFGDEEWHICSFIHSFALHIIIRQASAASIWPGHMCGFMLDFNENQKANETKS